MNKFYVACDIGADRGRVMLGHLDKEKLVLSEVKKFANGPIHEKDSVHWDVASVYHEMVDGLRIVGSFEETIESISCNSWGSDYLLFEPDGSLITPTFHREDPRWQAGQKWLSSRISSEAIYEETGQLEQPANTLFQLASEKSKRIERATQFLPVADGFNFLLSGVARAELSLASMTQLYNPAKQKWSERLLEVLKLPAELFPPLVQAGTTLAPLKPELIDETKLEDTRVVSSCSHEMAAAIAALPIRQNENWAYLKIGGTASLGTELEIPVINEESRRMNFANEQGFGGAIRFSKPAPGLRILEECQRYWKERDREGDKDMLMHLAASSPPLECFINPDDPRFQGSVDDMPLRIQAYCKETKQPVPRKPGPIIRCILESLALSYRKVLLEIERHTASQVSRVYLMGDTSNSLLNHFTANALQVPVVIATPEATVVGNVIVQALALGHLKSLHEARELVRRSFKHETILPYATAWNAAYHRLNALAVV